VPELKTLREREGTLSAALIPFIHLTNIQEVRLHLAEESGIWIESQSMIDTLLEAAGAQASPRTLVFFLPCIRSTDYGCNRHPCHLERGCKALGTRQCRP